MSDDQWLPIESAPKEGISGRRQVLVIGKYPTLNGWTDIYQSWWDHHDQCWSRWPHYFKPTHWMHLPDPPQEIDDSTLPTWEDVRGITEAMTTTDGWKSPETWRRERDEDRRATLHKQIEEAGWSHGHLMEKFADLGINPHELAEWIRKVAK